MCQPFSFFCFFNDRIDQFHVIFILICIGERFENFFMIDKIICMF